MGEFHEAVSHLLDAFARGVAIIRTQRGRRKADKIAIDPTSKSAEAHLSKTLKHNRVVVKDAYGKDLVRHGPSFAQGDAEAHSSLSSILLRLNAGFVSVIERFTRGLSTPSDYETLLSLSNASRQEAIDTISQLSERLSRSSLALVPLSPALRSPQQHHPSTHKTRTKKSTAGVKLKAIEDSKHTRSKSAPELLAVVAITPLGLATPEGWVRPKPGGRKHSNSSESSKSRSTTTTATNNNTHARSTAKARSPTHAQSSTPRERAPDSPSPRYQASPPLSLPTPIPQKYHEPSSPTRRLPLDPSHRRSIMSFASDSTKLGEIPAHKWARADPGEGYPIVVYYPLEPYQEPAKPRSRLRKLFRRGE